MGTPSRCFITTAARPGEQIDFHRIGNFRKRADPVGTNSQHQNPRTTANEVYHDIPGDHPLSEWIECFLRQRT